MAKKKAGSKRKAPKKVTVTVKLKKPVDGVYVVDVKKKKPKVLLF